LSVEIAIDGTSERKLLSKICFAASGTYFLNDALDAREISAAHPHLVVAALTAFSNTELLAAQASEFNPSYVGVCTNGAIPHAGWTEGVQCLVEAATRADVSIVINAIVGAAGLDATLAAVAAGKRVALANKETLVMAGALVAEACRGGGGELVPVDSEHSAILQCLVGRSRNDVRRLVLTASGGPFREWAPDRLATATIAHALGRAGELTAAADGLVMIDALAVPDAS